MPASLLDPLRSKVEEYLSLLDITPKTKSIHRKAILGFLALLLIRGRKTPREDDYDDYRCWLRMQRQQSISSVEYAVSCVRRFLSWSTENAECTRTAPSTTPRRKRTRRVSTLLSPDLYENLELLSKHDGVDIPAMLNVLVARYVAHRKDDMPPC